MIVVSDTSPLTNLAAIGQFDLLRQLFSEVHIADGVWAELNAGGNTWPGNQEVSAADWIVLHAVKPSTQLAGLRMDLDQGEAESILLAQSLNADVILLDENEGRRVAKQRGLKPLGVLGLLLSAKSKNLIKTVRPSLDTLRQ